MASSVKADYSTIYELLQYGPIRVERPMSMDEFIALHIQFPELQMEREKDGKVTIMTPVKKGSGRRESIINTYVGHWALTNQKGECYSPSTGIELPSGAVNQMNDSLPLVVNLMNNS